MYIYLLIYKIFSKKYLNILKGERTYIHSSSVVSSLNFLSNFIKINKIQFNKFIGSKPRIFISSLDRYTKSEKSFIEIEIENRNKFILYLEPSEHLITNIVPYSEKIENYNLENKNITFKINKSLDIFENIIAGTKILCNEFLLSDERWIAARISFKNFNLLKEDIEEISIDIKKVSQNVWVENKVFVNGEELCNLLFKKG